MGISQSSLFSCFWLARRAEESMPKLGPMRRYGPAQAVRAGLPMPRCMRDTDDAIDDDERRPEMRKMETSPGSSSGFLRWEGVAWWYGVRQDGGGG